MIKKNVICSQCKCVIMRVSFEQQISDERWENIRISAKHTDHPESDTELQDVLES